MALPRPRALRIATKIPAVMICSNGDEVAVTVVNLSNEGFCLAADQQWDIGETVRLRIWPYGEFTGQIIWSDDKTAGGRFLDRATF